MTHDELKIQLSYDLDTGFFTWITSCRGIAGASMILIAWDGTLPIRRYAIFRNLFQSDYAIVVTGKDLESAEKWGGFVSWLGAVKPPVTRNLSKLARG